MVSCKKFVTDHGMT